MTNDRLGRLPLVLWTLVLLAAAPVPAQLKDYAPYPQPDSGYVTDLADLLTADQEARLESWIYTTEKRRGFEMAVVTIGSIEDYPGAPADSIESFARGMFDAYGIGNMPDNRGVLLLIARNDRKARIELGAGYGRARDGDAERIMQRKIIPQFRRERYAQGIAAGTRAILSEFAAVRIVPGWVKIVLIAGIGVLIPVSVSLFRSGKRGWGWIVAGLVIILVLGLFRAVRATAKALPEGSSAGGWGGGFGGGFSGGGGSTGSW